MTEDTPSKASAELGGTIVPEKPPASPKPRVPPPQLAPAGRALADAIGALGLPVSEPVSDSAGFPTYQVAPDCLVAVGEALRDQLGITYLSCLTPLDWPDRWEVVYHLYSFGYGAWLALKTKIPKDQLTLRSVTKIWPAANWYEREGYDMFGLVFEGHPQLCRILMSDDWQTFPLRKDHPMDMEGGY